jgi:hypothetical protein
VSFVVSADGAQRMVLVSAPFYVTAKKVFSLAFDFAATASGAAGAGADAATGEQRWPARIYAAGALPELSVMRDAAADSSSLLDFEKDAPRFFARATQCDTDAIANLRVTILDE